MSSLHNQSVVEDIVSAFKTSQNQSWSTFSDKLTSISIPKYKNKDVFKSENPIELSDEDIPVFGLVPRLEKLILVSCDKCSMIVKSDCLHYHYKHRHNNQENDLHSVAQFIRPNLTTNKYKRPKLNVRKLPEKKIIDGVNIDPVVQTIKTEFDPDEFERISELNRATEQQNIIQYSDESTSVDLALHCTPGTSYFNEFCTQSSVQYPDHNEVNNQIVDYYEDLTKSLNLIEEMQIKESLDDLDDSINEDIVNCITEIESNEKIKHIIDYTDSINDNEEFYENTHRKKYDHFPLNQHSSLKTSSCSDVISNQSSDQEINFKITNSDKILNKLLDDGKEHQSIEYVDSIINSKTINYATESTDSLYKSLDSNEKRVPKIDLTDFINNGNNNYSVSRCNILKLKPHITSITSKKYPQVMKTQISDNFISQDHSINNKRTKCDKNFLDNETDPTTNKQFINNIFDEKTINYETSSEVPFIKPFNSNIKRKSSTDLADFMIDDNRYFKKKYCHSPIDQLTLRTSSNSSSIIGNSLHDNKTNCDKVTACIKNLNKFIKDKKKWQNDECLNDNINEKTVNYVRIPASSLAKNSKTSFSYNLKKKHRKNLKDSMHYTKYRFSSSNVTSKKQFDNFISNKNQSSVISESHENKKLNNIFSIVENEEVENKMDKINIYSKNFNFFSPKKLNDQKPKLYIPFNKDVKAPDNECFSNLNTVFDEPLTNEHKEFEDKIEENSKDFNFSSHLKLKNDEKLTQYVPTSKNAKEMCDQYFSDSSSISDKPLPDEYKDVEDIIEENSQDFNFSSPLKLINDGKPLENISTSKDVKAIANQCPIDLNSVFDKPLPDEHKEVEEKIDANFKDFNLSSPSRLDNDGKPIHYIPFSKDVKARYFQCSSNSSTILDKPLTVELEKVEDNLVINNTDSNVFNVSLPTRSLNSEESKQCIPTSKDVKSIGDQCPNNFISRFHESSSTKHEEVKDKLVKINVNSKIVYIPLSPSLQNNKNLKKYVRISKNVKTMDDQCTSDSTTCLQKSSILEPAEVKEKMDKTNDDSKVLYFKSPPKSLNDKVPKKYIPISKFVKGIDNNSFYKSSTVEHEKVKDGNTKVNADSNTLYFLLPPKSSNNEKSKKCMPIGNNIKLTNDQCSSDTVPSFHKLSTVNHEGIENEMDNMCDNSKTFYFPLPPRLKNNENQEEKCKFDKLNTNSKILYFSLPSKSISDKNPKKYFPIRQFVKLIQNQNSSNSVGNFHKSSSVEHEEVGDKMDKINDNSKILYFPLPPRSMNFKNHKKYIPVNKYVKTIDDQCSSYSDTNFHKSSTTTQSAKENIKIASNYIYSNSISNDDEKNEESNIQFDKIPSKLMQNNIKNKWLPCYSHSTTFPSNKENPKLAQTNFNIKSTTNTDADVFQDKSSFECPRVKKKFKLSPISDHVVHEEYCYNGSYDAYYQAANDYTISQALKPLSPSVKYSDSDIDTSSEEEQNDDINESLKNEWCTSSSELSSYENETQLESTDAYTNILNKESSNDVFTNYDRSSTTLLDKPQSKHLPFDDSSAITDSYFKIKKEFCQFSSKNDLTQSKLTPNKYDLSKESPLTSASSYNQSSVLSKDMSTDTKSDNFVNKLLDVIKNSKYTQTDGSFKCISHKKCIDAITRIDNSIAESCGTYDDKTKCNQTNLLLGCMNYYETTKDLVDSHDPINSNAEIVQNETKNSYTCDMSSSQIDECISNSSTSDSSSLQSTYNTLAPTSVEEEYESINDENYDRYNSNSSHNDHFFNYLIHHPISDNNQGLENKDKTCSSNTDKTVQNEYNYNIDEQTSDIVDKYFQSYKDRLKKTADEKCINGKNSKLTPSTDIEAKVKKNSKRRLEVKAVDKENHRYGLWDERESCLSYIGRTFNFVVRPALRQSHFSEESD